MHILKRAGAEHRPSLVPAMPDSAAARERAEYLIAHYHAPPAIAERVVAGMDIPTQTLLAIEMAELRREAYTADYDPFGTM